jgi:hypothetical protein
MNIVSDYLATTFSQEVSGPKFVFFHNGLEKLRQAGICISTANQTGLLSLSFSQDGIHE